MSCGNTSHICVSVRVHLALYPLDQQEIRFHLLHTGLATWTEAIRVTAPWCAKRGQ